MSILSTDITNREVTMLWTSDVSKLEVLTGNVGELVFVSADDEAGGLYVEGPNNYERIAVNTTYVDKQLDKLVDIIE